ncbi:serine O-acetyltransferase EpsC [Thermodesulfobacteriota bacterium]
MTQHFSNAEICKDNQKSTALFYEKIPLVVKQLVESCDRKKSFDHVDSTPIPSQEVTVEIIYQARRILFPGYFSQTRLDPVNLAYSLGKETTELFENLSKQIMLSLQHDCLRYEQPCSKCIEQGRETALRFIQALPEIKEILTSDIQAAMEGDPAAKSTDEIIFSYPGLFAITVYRLSHVLFDRNVPLIPRMMTEYAHGLTGIDIHPGAKIGKSFFIDHGTGVVVGETTEIGDHVRLYQGVTLGALSLPRDAGDRFRNMKRHPTIGDNVIIYSNATLLGAEAEVGARSIIGGNVWITEKVPPDTKVLLKRPELIYIGNDKKAE